MKNYWAGLDNLDRLSAVCALFLIAATLFALAILMEVS
jgi:hypothetical protein